MTGPASVGAPLDQAREAFGRGAWGAAHAAFHAADRAAPLPPEDVERLAIATRLLGRDAEAHELLARAHQEFLARGETEGAARTAFWIGFQLLLEREHARSSGWLGRAQRLLDEAGADSVVRGYLRLPVAYRGTFSGEYDEALAACRDIVSAGERFGDTTLVMFGRMARGRALIRQGSVAEGVALLDEVMVAVTAGEIAPSAVADVYCSVLEGCHEIFDLRRAQEWTDALSRWCESHPDLVAQRGQCLVRRAEILQLHGAWPDAMDEACRACEQLAARAGRLSLGAAFYQRADLHRLRGEFARAEEAYRQASLCGRTPQPGLALLRLTQGQPEAAAAAIRGAMTEPSDRQTRARLLGAAVEILLAVGDLAGARAAAEELARIAAALDAPYLRALGAQAAGAVRLAEGDARGALPLLRAAAADWRELDAPYEVARVRLLIARALGALDDADTAALELDAARESFARLGAAPDLARLTDAPTAASSPLTSRELEVLRLLATGRTNRAIAEALGISEKTVARHVSNIFLKLALSSRAAATAYAYEHRLL